MGRHMCSKGNPYDIRMEMIIYDRQRIAEKRKSFRS